MAAKAKATPARRRAKAAKAPARARAKTSAKADKAAARAKAAGATGGRLTATQRHLRDSAILLRVAAGTTWQACADEFKLTKRAVADVVKRSREVRSPLEDPPMAIIEDLARSYRRSAADFLALAVATENDSVRLGAMKAADTARERYAELMATIGKLPRDLDLFRQQAQLERMADELRETMRAVRDGELDAGEAYVRFEGMVEANDPRRSAYTLGPGEVSDG